MVVVVVVAVLCLSLLFCYFCDSYCTPAVAIATITTTTTYDFAPRITRELLGTTCYVLRATCCVPRTTHDVLPRSVPLLLLLVLPLRLQLLQLHTITQNCWRLRPTTDNGDSFNYYCY